jgi:hypothetical protein
LLISEMGGTTAHAYATQSEGDVAHIHRVLWEVVNGPQVRGLVHYTTWKGDDSLDGVRDPKGGLSPRGRVFLEERQAFPSQSDFR